MEASTRRIALAAGIVFGLVAPDTTVTRTQRGDLSISEALKVSQNDGWITIIKTVSPDEITITFKERQDIV